MEPEEIDLDVRRLMSSPKPSLSATFERRLAEEVKRRSTVLEAYRRIILVIYALISVAACILILRSQGLEWQLVSTSILVPLAIGVLAPRMQSKKVTDSRDSA